MNEQERNQILQMIENGKITPEEALNLLKALDPNPVEGDMAAGEPEVGTGSAQAAAAEAPEARAEQCAAEAGPNTDRVKTAARRLWQFSLWIGIGITVLSALGMYGVMRRPGMNFWFYLLMLPLFLGVATIALAVGSSRTRWIFVDVHQRYGDWPERIFFGFPLPPKVTTWFLNTLRRNVSHLGNSDLDKVIQRAETDFADDEPLIVNVDEGSPGERVRVYIGVPSIRRPIWPVWKNA